jgi:hypothetical protein
MVLCTQVVSAQILSMPVRGNLPGKVVFRQVNRDASNTAIGDNRAWTMLEHTGMAFMCDEKGGETLVQTPLIFEEQRDEVIQTVIDRMEGRTYEERAVTIEEMARYALDNYKGLIRIRDMWKRFRGRITKDKLQDLIKANYEKPLILYPDGLRTYVIIRGEGSSPNRVICVSLVWSDVRENRDPDIPPQSPKPALDHDNGSSPSAEVVADDDEELDYDEYKQMMELANKQWRYD